MQRAFAMPKPADILTGIRWTRYTNAAFPPYRFIPGYAPHPTLDPRGHSYGREQNTKHLSPNPGEWRKSHEYLYGCDLYNHAYWWEAHEAWEDLWRGTRRGEPIREFLQGLIQISACHLKLHLGHTTGVIRLYHAGSRRLRSIVSVEIENTYMGLNLEEFLRTVQAYYGIDETGSPRRIHHNPQCYPYVCLES